MDVRRWMRLAAAGGWAWMAVATHAAADAGACGADAAPCATAAREVSAPSAVAPQSTALVVPHAGEFARAGSQALSYMPLEAARSVSGGATIAETVTRADSEAVVMADHEIYALIGAALVAVLSLSRRRNL